MQCRQKESVTDQLTHFIFYKFWKWKQMTFSFCIVQIINLQHRNLNSFSLFHGSDKDISQLCPLKQRHQKLQYIFSVSFPKITLPKKQREKIRVSALMNGSSRISSWSLLYEYSLAKNGKGQKTHADCHRLVVFLHLDNTENVQSQINQN